MRCSIRPPSGYSTRLGEMIGEQDGQIVGGPVQQLVPGYLAELIIPTGVVIDAQRDGSYGVEFEIDGDRLRVHIHIVVGAAGG